MTKEEALKILDTIPTIGEQVDALEMAINALEQSERKHGRWIPCSERLPDKDGRYLVTCKKYCINYRFMCFFNFIIWCTFF